MEYWYGARSVFNLSHGLESWEKYKQWILLPQLVDLISLDYNLNEDLIALKSYCIQDCEVKDNGTYTGLYASLEFVIDEMKNDILYNLLIVVKNPQFECNSINVSDFEFIGYDILDSNYHYSILTNCGGFCEIYSPTDINKFGLIDDYDKAVEINKLFNIKIISDHNEDSNLFAIWRHRTLGR